MSLFIWSFRMSKRELIIIGVGLLLFIAAAAAIIGTAGSRAASAVPGGHSTAAADEESRAAFIRGFGWEIQEEPLRVKEITMPDSGDSGFLEYNELQKKQGFDLTSYCGRRVKLWTYRVTNHPAGDRVLASLVICDGQIIGGDISAASAGGFSHGFDPALFSAEIAQAQSLSSTVDRTVPDSIPAQADAPTEEELDGKEEDIIQ